MGKEIFINKSGHAIINKMKINDVSSHYSKGKFILCFYCISRQNLYTDDNSFDSYSKEIYVDAEEIKPLLMSNISVKSKKNQIKPKP